MDKDLQQLSGLIREALGRTSLTTRALEQELGLGHGNLTHLLSGKLELKIRHLLGIARLLGVPPHRLVELGCPDALRAATQDVTDFIDLPAAGTADGAISSLTLAALDARIRAIVRDELAAASAATPGP
jgi:transcriptional regulator with XRE-family HTH domain